MSLSSVRSHAARAVAASLAMLLLSACSGARTLPDQPTVASVDLPRFMGDWYVIASIPTFIEKQAYNAIETYRIDTDGTIDTTFTFNKGGFDGKPKRYNPRGFVREGTGNAIWGMRFVWPVKADYRIVFLDDAYTRTIIGRDKRDYVWVMARTPTIPDDEYAQLVERLRALGYDVAKLRKVPQRG